MKGPPSSQKLTGSGFAKRPIGSGLANDQRLRPHETNEVYEIVRSTILQYRNIGSTQYVSK